MTCFFVTMEIGRGKDFGESWFCFISSSQDFQRKLEDARRIVVVGNGGIATELVLVSSPFPRLKRSPFPRLKRSPFPLLKPWLCCCTGTR